MAANGKVWINGTQQIFDGEGYFTGSSSRSITLYGRTGYTRTWRVKKEWSVGGVWYNENMDSAYTGSSYSVYISSLYIWPVWYYYDTKWTFESTDTIIRYTLSYNSNGGSLSGGTGADTYNYNTTITLPTGRTRTGYTFTNFTINGNALGDTFSLTGNTEVVANWTINRYTLSYNANGGSLSGGTGAGTYNYNSTITLPTGRTRTGYTFTNFTSGGNAFGATFNLTANTAVVANWSINQYTVTYLSSTPQYFGFPSSSIPYNYNTLLTATIITKNPPRVIGQVYTFDKWTYNDNSLGTTRLPANNITLKATWTSVDNREIQMSELVTVFDNSPSFQNIEISNYFDELQLISTDDKKDVKFSTKLKGKGKF
jgi:hypothetical protein